MILKNVEKKENNTTVFTVATDAAEFEAAVNGAYLKNKGSIYIPGFRKGKAPRTVVEGMYGAEVFYQDAIDELAPKAFDFGITESGIRFVGRPSIADMNVTEERVAEYSFSVELYPEATLGQYKGIEAERAAVVVTDEDVENELQSVLKRNARKVSVEREAQLGDTANIDFDGYLDGERFDGGKSEGYDLELGSNTFVPGFEDQIVGMQIGEEKDLDITFPENYAEGLAGKAVVFKVKLNSLTYPELPELDDEFAKDVSEFDTLDEYKASLKENITKQRADMAEAETNNEIMKKAAENMSVEIPAVMIEDKIEEIVRSYASNFGVNASEMTMEDLMKLLGMDEEVINNNIRPSAEVQVKNDILLDAVLKAEGIEVTEEDTEEYIKKMAESYSADAEQLKAYFGTAYIVENLKREKAADVILDSAVITEK